MSRFSGPVEAILSLYEEGKDITYILKVLDEELKVYGWYENGVKYYLKVKVVGFFRQEKPVS